MDGFILGRRHVDFGGGLRVADVILAAALTAKCISFYLGRSTNRIVGSPSFAAFANVGLWFGSSSPALPIHPVG